MSFRSPVRPLVLAILAATPLLTAPNAARAQGLIDFLWGGTDEWGGKRQVVDFDPKYSADQVIVSFGDRRLYLITQKGKAISYPIAVPREQSRWEGTTTVSSKKENPSWRPTPDMLRENPKLPTWVPGGHPMNPLGVRAMYLGASTYRIHGTDAPWTIGQAVSKGCIRMINEDVLDLYPRVPVGMKVTVTWQQFNPQAVASNDDSSSASPLSYEPPAVAGTSSKGSTRSIRNLPPPPSSIPATAGVTPDNVGAANKMAPPDPSTEDKPAKPIVKAKPKVKKPEAVAATTPSIRQPRPRLRPRRQWHRRLRRWHRRPRRHRHPLPWRQRRKPRARSKPPPRRPRRQRARPNPPARQRTRPRRPRKTPARRPRPTATRNLAKRTAPSAQLSKAATRQQAFEGRSFRLRPFFFVFGDAGAPGWAPYDAVARHDLNPAVRLRMSWK